MFETDLQRILTDLLGLKLTKHIAMDCEMVGVGFQGKDHMLARISIVNQQGDIIMDKYVKPSESVSICP